MIKHKPVVRTLDSGRIKHLSNELKRLTRAYNVANSSLIAARQVIKDADVDSVRDKKDLEQLQFEQDARFAVALLMQKNNPEEYKAVTRREFGKIVSVFQSGAEWFRDKV